MATDWEYFKAQVGSYDLRVYNTVLRQDGSFTVDKEVADPTDYYRILLVIVDNIGSFIHPDVVSYNPYFCIVEMKYGNDVIEFDSSSMTYRFVSKEEEI
mgnify:CR=1 FL=1